MLMVPVRPLPLFAVALNVTEPFPTPDAPPVMVIQGTDAVAVQLHPVTADTLIGDPAPAGTAKITCFTCHRGAVKPLTAPGGGGQ